MALAVGYPIPYQTSENPHERADENQAFRCTEQVTAVKHLKFRFTLLCFLSKINNKSDGV